MKKCIMLLLLISNASEAHHVITQNEKECVSWAIYHEAAHEPSQGQYAIMNVIKNRSDSKEFKEHNLCDVIKSKKQFSFYNNGWKPAKDKRLLQQISTRVESFYNGLNVGIVNGAKWYHADYVNPRWSNKLNRVKQIGTHIFYN